MLIKEQCKRILFGGRNLSQWLAVGIEGEPEQISISLHGLEATLDVTRNCVVAALRPLTFGVGLEASLEELHRAQLSLRFEDSTTKRHLGEVGLMSVNVLTLENRRLALFQRGDYRNRYFSQLHVAARYLAQSYRIGQQRKKHDPYNLKMARPDLESMFLFYTRPRPVVLVTVVYGENSNIFPMDLIGPTETGYFTLALRSTSPAVELIKASRRVALSGVPAAQVAIAYELGKHHKKQSIDWNALRMEMTKSPLLGLPVPRFALDVREMCVDHVHTIESHTLFAAKTMMEHRGTGGSRLFHVPGYFADYCERIGRPLQKAGV